MPKQTHTTDFDIAIIGGGLAGLGLSIQLAKAGWRVVLFEKEKYPFHRVCGEYISFESWNFLEELGVPLSDWDLPMIKNLMVSAPNGKSLEEPLPLGGFGISRYTLDDYMQQLAQREGVTVMDDTRVDEAVFDEAKDWFVVNYHNSLLTAKMVCGCFGKRSNLDMKWQRDFVKQKPNKLNNYIGIKYHVRINQPEHLIALHNFDQGYCGISKVDNDRYCLCYLTTADNLKHNGNSIEKMEQQVIRKNPHLERIFSEAEFLFSQPVAIAQISFSRKTLVEDHMLMIGDASGMITPLCGNGMSMALHESKIAFELLQKFLQGDLARKEMEAAYQIEWRKYFEHRLKTGRFIQSMFGKKWLSNVFIQSMKPFPKLIRYLIRQTHGEPF